MQNNNSMALIGDDNNDKSQIEYHDSQESLVVGQAGKNIYLGDEEPMNSQDSKKSAI